MTPLARLSTALFLSLFAALAAAQFTPQVGQAGKDVIWVPTPDDVVERMLVMAQVTPNDFVWDLGAGDGKIAIMAARKFGARAVGNRLLVAGIAQWSDHPEEWPGGMEGFGMRFGASMGRTAVRNSIRLASDVAFGIDPRFDRCDCEGVRARTIHAWRRVVISRSDNGRVASPCW